MAILWTFLTVLLLGVAVREMRLAPRRRLQAMVDRVGRMEVDLPPSQKLLTWAKDRVVQRLPLLTGTGSIEELRSLVLWAGRPFGLGAEEVYFLQIVTAVVGGLFFTMSFDWYFGIAGGIGGMLAPRWWLRGKVAENDRAIRHDLPQFVHLLATSLEAGLSLTEAVRRVTRESPGLLSREMERTILEIATGKPAQRAWMDLMARTTCQELKEIVTAIMQSQEYGVAIAEQLRFTMRAIRQRKQQQAQQKAQEAAVKMRVPMVLCILVPTMIIVLGPSALAIMRVFGG